MSYLSDFELAGVQQGYQSMLRDGYSDIGNRFMPMESQLMNQYQNPQGFDADALGYASSGVSDALGRAQAQLTRNNRNGGYDEDAQEAQQRRLNLAGGSSLSSARTGILGGLNQRDDAMRQSLMGFANQDRTQALNQMGFLSGLSVSRDATNQQLGDAARDRRNSTIGGALGAFTQGAASGNPLTGAITGGISLLGSLF